VTLEWAPPADNGCPLTGYRIYQDTDEDGVADGADIYPGVGDEDDPFANGLDASVLEFIKGGLTTAQRYGFQVRAYNARGSTYSDWAYIRAAGEPVAMSQPSQDVASSSSTSIGLAWSVPDMQGGTCVGFKVFRDDGSGTDVSTVADATCGSERKPAPQSCVISGLKYGEIYTIRMLAINDVGEGPYSDTVEYRAATYPSQITNLTNTAASYDDVSLTFTWDAPADNGAAVFNYVGEVYKMDDGTTTTWDAGGDAGNPQTSLTVVLQDPQVSNMFAGLQYKFRVAAINEAGTGAWSDWSDTTVDAPRGYIMDPPNVPTAFARKDPSAAVTNEVSISWTGPTNTGEAGGDAPGNVQYEVYSGTTTSNMVLVNTVSTEEYTESTTYQTVYYYKVRAVNSAGLTSAFTSILSLVSATVPGQVDTLTGSSNTQDQVVLSWNPPSDDGGTVITKYQVYSPTTATWTDVDSTLLTATLTGEPGGSTWTYEVRAVNGVGEGTTASVSVAVAAATR